MSGPLAGPGRTWPRADDERAKPEPRYPQLKGGSRVKKGVLPLGALADGDAAGNLTNRPVLALGKGMA